MSAPPATGREAGTLSSLRALLDVAAVVRSRDDLSLLEATAATIAQEMGFGVVVVNMHRPAWDDYQVVVGEDADEEARQTLVGITVSPGEL